MATKRFNTGGPRVWLVVKLEGITNSYSVRFLSASLEKYMPGGTISNFQDHPRVITHQVWLPDPSDATRFTSEAASEIAYEVGGLAVRLSDVHKLD